MSYVRSADGCRIHYRVTGRSSAPPLLMIQGLGMDKHGWDIQRFVFSLRYRVIALDNRGAGRSDKPTGDYDLGQMAADAVAVLDDVGVDRAHVVGASMGGAIAQFLAVLWPERVRSLTLVCTSCRNQLWRKELLESWAWDAENRGMGAMAGHAARWVIGPRSFRRLVPLVGWLGPLGFGRSAEAFAAQVDAILAADDSLAERLATISVPTLVVVGNQDILTPRGDSEELAEAIPTAELVVISGAAHGLMIEHATTFNRILGDFLSRAERAYQDGDLTFRRGARQAVALAGSAARPTRFRPYQPVSERSPVPVSPRFGRPDRELDRRPPSSKSAGDGDDGLFAEVEDRDELGAVLVEELGERGGVGIALGAVDDLGVGHFPAVDEAGEPVLEVDDRRQLETELGATHRHQREPHDRVAE